MHTTISVYSGTEAASGSAKLAQISKRIDSLASRFTTQHRPARRINLCRTECTECNGHLISRCSVALLLPLSARGCGRGTMIDLIIIRCKGRRDASYESLAYRRSCRQIRDSRVRSTPLSNNKPLAYVRSLDPSTLDPPRVSIPQKALRGVRRANAASMTTSSDS